MSAAPDAPVPAPSRWRTLLSSVPVRVALSAVMLTLLVWRLPDVHWRDLGPRWTPASPIWLIGAAVVLMSAFVLQAIRWSLALDALRPAPPFRRMLSHFLAGQFVSNVLPTAFGGDVLRVSRLGRDLDDHPAAFASVVIDRSTGWLVLPGIAAVAFAMQPELFDLGPSTALSVAIGIGTFVWLVAVLAVASNRRFSADVDEVTGWKRFLVAIHLGVDALRRNPRRTAEVVGVGFTFQALQCVAVWMCAHAIGLHAVSAGVVFAFFPIVAIAQNLPVGLGGLGVRESLFALFFGAVGANKALAITLGLVFYGLTILTSAAGAPAFVFGGQRGRRSRRGAAAASRNPHMDEVAGAPEQS